MLSFFLALLLLIRLDGLSATLPYNIYNSMNYLVSNYVKSYLRGGRMTKDTDRCLVPNYVKSYLQGGRITEDTNGYLVLKLC